ncbi:hypothetical protein NC661_13350 [Aquibacillus koreensis]|uniref:ParB/Sulfiredoxin domain-containing protein n=1 Tax=Aquibacillus koreensis TaxID=279446 RepID=A0A9X3WNC9_9BACI|nr:hypothetical protein [Aquibacillus koreensis]MCT2536293.1 hypothetical protein [Aquibacillus koreensis]MDC3421356.1 hypothetical protein [Aquibacillus koreensis]
MCNPDFNKIMKNNSSIIHVEVSKCCDWQGFSYTEDGWHYLCATLKEYIKQPSIKYENSILNRYYSAFQPKSLFEILLPNYKCNTETQDKHSFLPWGTPINMKAKNNQHFGPNSDTFTKNEFDRTIEIYKKIASEGYQPHRFRDGYIRGQFLKKYDDYRFMISGGQHRMAAISVLGFKTIEVKIQPKWEKLIDIEDINLWPNVQNGSFNKEEATNIFDAYFSTIGREKAKRLNLLHH